MIFNRDHATVLYGMKTIRKHIETYPKLSKEISKMELIILNDIMQEIRQREQI